MNENVVIDETQEKSLSIGELFFLVKKNIILIIVITILCTAAASVYGLFFKERSYTASASTMVMVDVDKKGTQTTTEYTNYMYSTQLINTYNDFVVSKNIINKTIEALKDKGYDLSYETIKKNLSLSSKTNSLVVTISYTAHGNGKDQEAIDVVNTLVDTIIYTVNNEKNSDDKLKWPILSNSIESIDQADKAVGKRGATTIILIGILAGLVISFGIVLIKYLTDDTFKSREEFERVFKINVLAQIPDLQIIKGDEKNESSK